MCQRQAGAFQNLVSEVGAGGAPPVIHQLGQALFEIMDRFDPQEIGDWSGLSEQQRHFYAESVRELLLVMWAALEAPTTTKYSGAPSAENS